MKFIMLILIAIGVTLIYDAREITMKYFSDQDKNKTTMLIKILGFIISAICGTIIVAI